MTDRMQTDPAGYWNEEAGQRWVASQEALDHTMTPITETLMTAAAVTEGKKVIDVGCGCGETTVRLGRAVGKSGRVLGVDVSEPMLSRAAERTRGLPVTLVLADAATHPFETEKTDLLLSRFGVMFFPDPTRAFTNLHRALVPRAGRLTFVAWQAPNKNPWLRSAMAALPEYEVAGASPVDEPGPFGLATRERTEQILFDAGFRDVTLTPWEAALSMGGTPKEATRLSSQTGPLSRLLPTVDAKTQEELLLRVERYYEERWGTEQLRFDCAYWLVEASA